MTKRHDERPFIPSLTLEEYHRAMEGRTRPLTQSPMSNGRAKMDAINSAAHAQPTALDAALANLEQGIRPPRLDEYGRDRERANERNQRYKQAKRERERVVSQRFLKSMDWTGE